MCMGATRSRARRQQRRRLHGVLVGLCAVAVPEVLLHALQLVGGLVEEGEPLGYHPGESLRMTERRGARRATGARRRRPRRTDRAARSRSCVSVRSTRPTARFARAQTALAAPRVSTCRELTAPAPARCHQQRHAAPRGADPGHRSHAHALRRGGYRAAAASVRCRAPVPLCPDRKAAPNALLRPRRAGRHASLRRRTSPASSCCAPGW